MSEMEFVEKGYRITGRVQGVFFRAWTRAAAEELGLRGMVRNRSDGSVETHVSGPVSAVKEFEVRLWGGPPSSAVASVEMFSSSS